MAALILVTFDDLFFLDLLPGAGIVRPQRDPGSAGGLICLLEAIIIENAWPLSVPGLLPFD
jgi:hypothetical protein